MIFLDSSFIISFQVEEDSNHSRSVKIMRDIVRGKYGQPVVSDYIFSETVTVILARTKRLQRAVQTGETMRQSYEIKKVDESLFTGAWNYFRKQMATRFSFTDCTTLAILAKTDIRNMATFDEEFKSVGTLNIVG